jgi:hypothetical protein
MRGRVARWTCWHHGFLFSWPWWMGSVVKHNMLKIPLADFSNIVTIFPTFSIYDFNYTKRRRRKPLTTIPPPARTQQRLQTLFETRTDPLNHVRAPHHVSCHLIGGFHLNIYNFFHMKWYVLINKSFTDIFQILVMQCRRHFIYFQSFQVFS